MRPALTAPLIAGLLALTAACSEVPDLGIAIDPSVAAAPYPPLSPTASLPTGIDDQRLTDASTADLAGRGDRLRRRADALRRRQVD